MSLVTSLELMKIAEAKHYAIPSFNVDNLESVMAVTEVVKELNTPVIIQTIPRTLKYGGINTYPAMVKALMADCPTDYCLHLDHGNSFALAKTCIESGFSSVMIDGSALPLADNINITKTVVDYAKKLNISVEGELGAIGGKEDGDKNLSVAVTKVNEAIEFVSKSGVDTLAIGVGTAHGIYKGVPKINVVRIAEIHNAITTPIVLHGASGLSDKVIRCCIEAGISKINFATELRQAFTLGLRNSLSEDTEVFDPKIYMRKAIDEIKKVVVKKVRLCYGLFH